MKQVYRSYGPPFFPRTQIVGKRRLLTATTIEEAQANLEKAAKWLIKNARWSGYMSPLNNLRVPLLELRLLRRKLK